MYRRFSTQPVKEPGLKELLPDSTTRDTLHLFPPPITDVISYSQDFVSLFLPPITDVISYPPLPPSPRYTTQPEEAPSTSSSTRPEQPPLPSSRTFTIMKRPEEGRGGRPKMLEVQHFSISAQPEVIYFQYDLTIENIDGSHADLEWQEKIKLMHILLQEVKNNKKVHTRALAYDGARSFYVLSTQDYFQMMERSNTMKIGKYVVKTLLLNAVSLAPLAMALQGYISKEDGYDMIKASLRAIDVVVRSGPITGWSPTGGEHINLRVRDVKPKRTLQKDCIQTLINALREYNTCDAMLLKGCGICIWTKRIAVEGRILNAPALKCGKSIEDIIPFNGHWNLNKRKLIHPCKVIKQWVVVDFSSSCDLDRLCSELRNTGKKKGLQIEPPLSLFEEDAECRNYGPCVRVANMYDKITTKLCGMPPTFILCVLPRKNCDIYASWKKFCLLRGIINQCISPATMSDQYLTNVILKINIKHGGENFLLAIDQLGVLLQAANPSFMILGMDLCHGSSGLPEVPSVAAVVGTIYPPTISKYRESARIQSPKVRMIDSLSDIMRELWLESPCTSLPRADNVIIFRNGVSESQFDQVLNFELKQIIQAFEGFGTSIPKFTVIVAQKSHRTKLVNEVFPGAVVDTEVVHPTNYDFYLSVGSSRLVHYTVLLDEIGFRAGELQSLVYSLCYVNQCSTKATSHVAPICSARRVAAQMAKLIKTPNSEGTASLPSMIHPDLRGSMFFC